MRLKLSPVTLMPTERWWERLKRINDDMNITVTTTSIADDLKLTPQARTVLSYLRKHGRISPAKADRVFGITRLASCIHEIRRRAGYKVSTTINRDEQGHKYSEYKLLLAEATPQ
jgi:hypothetical protein